LAVLLNPRSQIGSATKRVSKLPKALCLIAELLIFPVARQAGLFSNTQGSDGGFQSPVAGLAFSSKYFSRNKESNPTLHGHPLASEASNRHQSLIAQPINHNGRRIAIPEEREIAQKTQIAAL
jgi:hypothetical protein